VDLIDLCSLLLKDSEGVYVYEPTTVETTQGKETGGPSKRCTHFIRVSGKFINRCYIRSGYVGRSALRGSFRPG